MGISQENLWNIIVNKSDNKSYIAYRNNGLVDTVVLTDGGDNQEHCAESLKWLAEQCCRTMLEEFPRYLEIEEFQAKRSFLLSLRRLIEECMERTGLPKESCSSTILSACVDWGRGLYCAFQLGNGIIITNGAIPEPVFYPFNFRRKRDANTTIAEEALVDLRFVRGNMEDIQGFILLATDRYTYPLCERELLGLVQAGECRKEELERLGIAVLHREGHIYGRKDEYTGCGKRRE